MKALLALSFLLSQISFAAYYLGEAKIIKDKKYVEQNKLGGEIYKFDKNSYYSVKKTGGFSLGTYYPYEQNISLLDRDFNVTQTISYKTDYSILSWKMFEKGVFYFAEYDRRENILYLRYINTQKRINKIILAKKASELGELLFHGGNNVLNVVISSNKEIIFAYETEDETRNYDFRSSITVKKMNFNGEIFFEKDLFPDLSKNKLNRYLSISNIWLTNNEKTIIISTSITDYFLYYDLDFNLKSAETEMDSLSGGTNIYPDNKGNFFFMKTINDGGGYMLTNNKKMISMELPMKGKEKRYLRFPMFNGQKILAYDKNSNLIEVPLKEYKKFSKNCPNIKFTATKLKCRASQYTGTDFNSLFKFFNRFEQGELEQIEVSQESCHVIAFKKGILTNYVNILEPLSYYGFQGIDLTLSNNFIEAKNYHDQREKLFKSISLSQSKNRLTISYSSNRKDPHSSSWFNLRARRKCILKR